MYFNGDGSSIDIRVLNNYALNNPFLWNRYTLIVEFTEVINFVEVIETIIETKLNLLTIWIREEILAICKPLVIFTIFSINTRLFTCLEYVYKDSWKIYVRNIRQW